MSSAVDAIFLNGTVGSGKTTVAYALSASESVPHALIDLDAIRQFSPTSTFDPFNHELELQNLASLAANYRRAGAQRFILAGVIEDATEVARYRAALACDQFAIYRLVASPAVLAARLTRRHADDAAERDWHLARSGELAQILESALVDETLLDTSDRTPTELATIIRSDLTRRKFRS